MLRDNPSKAEELAHWRTFLSSLPPCSYLAMYLAGSDEQLAQAMAQDMSTELIPAIRRQRQEALADLAEAEKAKRAAQDQRDAMQRDVDALRRDAVRLRNEMRQAVQAADALARQAGEAYSRAVAVLVAG